MLFSGSEMTLDKLLRGVRSLVLSSALAYSACGGSGGDECERDSDCEGDRVCERDPNTGERYCASPSEGEAEAEGEGERIPWYEGMCEEWRDLLLKGGGDSKNIIESYEYQPCLLNCGSMMNSDIDHKDCARIYCGIRVFNPSVDHDRKEIYSYREYWQCMETFGYKQEPK